MKKPRLAMPNPCNPAAYNREQTLARTISRSAGASAVRCLDEQANQSIDERIADIKARARSRIGKIATQATVQIARLEEKRGKK